VGFFFFFLVYVCVCLSLSLLFHFGLRKDVDLDTRSQGESKESAEAGGRAAAGLCLAPLALAGWGTRSRVEGFYSRPYRSPRGLPSQSGGAGQSQRQTGLIQAPENCNFAGRIFSSQLKVPAKQQ